MTHKASIAICVALLAACAPVENETRSTLVVDGRSYELRTEVVDGPRGQFERSAVIVKNRRYTCLANSPGDCEATVRLARTDFDRD